VSIAATGVFRVPRTAALCFYLFVPTRGAIPSHRHEAMLNSRLRRDSFESEQRIGYSPAQLFALDV
jgi:hypothetical protein